MVDYTVIGNTPFSELFGGDKEVTEKFLKGLNYSKEIAVLLGKEYNPPYIWNKNIPKSWVEIICGAVIDEMRKDKNWKPDEAFIDKIRQKLKEVK